MAVNKDDVAHGFLAVGIFFLGVIIGKKTSQQPIAACPLCGAIACNCGQEIANDQ